MKNPSDTLSLDGVQMSFSFTTTSPSGSVSFDVDADNGVHNVDDGSGICGVVDMDEKSRLAAMVEPALSNLLSDLHKSDNEMSADVAASVEATFEALTEYR